MFTCIQGNLSGAWAPGIDVWWNASLGNGWPWDEHWSDTLDGLTANGPFCITIPRAPIDANGDPSIWYVHAEHGFGPGGPGGPTGGVYAGAIAATTLVNGAHGVPHDGTSGHCDLGTCMDVGILDITFYPN